MTYCGEKTLPSETNASSAANPHSTRWRASGRRAASATIHAIAPTSSSANSRCTSGANPPSRPLDLKRSGRRFVPVTSEPPRAKSTVAGVDSICTGRSR